MAKQVSRLLLYKRDASPPSCAVMMLGDLLGLKFDYYEPDLLKLEHKSPEYKKINPMGTVPVLRDGDFIVSESHAIMTYLLSKYGGDQKEKLYPSDPQRRAIVDQCLFFDAGVLFNKLKVVALPTIVEGLPGPTPQHIVDIDDGYSIVEGYLDKYLYVAGERFTIADISIGTTVSALQAIHELNKDRFPRSVEWLSRLHQEDCFKKINEPGAANFKKLLKFFWSRNKSS